MAVWADSLVGPALNVAQFATVCAPLSSLTAVGSVAVKLGMSLTGVTMMAAVSVAVLIPILMLVLAVLPLVPAT